jgi:hypothetical protein
MRKAIQSLLCFGIALGAAPAGATDYTFNVPVRIENMANATEAWVSCDIYQGALGSRRSVGFGRTDIRLSSGAYSGNVAVNVNAAPGYTATDADSWGCGLVYIWNMPDGTPFMRSLYTDERNGLYTRYTGQDVASSHLNEGGAISR